MSRVPHRLRAFASHLEDDTPPARAEQIAGWAFARAERRVIARLRSFAYHLEAGTRAALAERIAVQAAAAGSRLPIGYVLRRVGALAAATAVVFVGAAGVGAIANHASPGDLLYGVDLAYEAAGHVLDARAPHTEERLTEALTLIDRGRGADAIALVDQAVQDYSVEHGLRDLEKEYAATRLLASAEFATATTAPSTPVTAASTPPSTIAAVDEQTDLVQALRLAVEMLLRNVQAKDASPEVVAAAVTDSALQAAAAASAVEGTGSVLAAETSTSTTADTTTTEPTTVAVNTITLPDNTPTTVEGGATTTSSATTLTMPDETATSLPGETTATTAPEGSSTTTTVPNGTSTTTTTAPDDGFRGIILSPQP